MPLPSSSDFSPFSQLIERFFYEPVTNWGRFFNPQVIFNYNPEDEGVERHVLGKVGSYGSQLATLIDMIEALKVRVEAGAWGPDAGKPLEEFETLRRGAQQAVDEYRGKATPDDIVAAVKALQARGDPAVLADLTAWLQALLAPAPTLPAPGDAPR